jgi:cytochrome c oxidase subunit II
VLSPAGVAAQHLALLGWWLIGVACAVVVIVTVALVIPLRWRRRTLADSPPTGSPDRDQGIASILIFSGISLVVLAGAFAATVVTLRATQNPPRPPALTVRVVGHQWWWEVQYVSPDPERSVITANEIHVPVGQPVRLVLQSADVVHSFWIPQLAGKVDLIPGETNVSWIEADRVGTFDGQCAKYCGMQHTQMRLSVVADAPETFTAWLDGQRAPAPAPTDSLAAAGQAAFVGTTCAFCHTIRGTPAGGRVGPDLTHLASRQMIAAGTLPNSVSALMGWVADAPGLKPGTVMPRMDLDPRTLAAIVTYLRTLN